MIKPLSTGSTSQPVFCIITNLADGKLYHFTNYGTGYINTGAQRIELQTTNASLFGNEVARGVAALYPRARTS